MVDTRAEIRNTARATILARQAGLQATAAYGVLAVIMAAGLGLGKLWLGPVSVVAACGVVWWFLVSGGEGWSVVGLTRSRNPLRVLAWSLAGSRGR